jgi:glycosyltransferase involved in cell wall biosynthesis
LAEAFYLKTVKRKFERLLHEYDSIGVVSRVAQAEMQRATLLRPKLLELGTDSEDYKGVVIDGKKYDAIFVGRLIPTKGLEDMIEVWARVVAKLPHAQFIIVGDGESSYLGKLQTRINANGLSQNIHMVGPKFGVDKIRLLKESRALLFLSHTEASPLAIDEAIRAELPIVAYNLSTYETRQKICTEFYTYQRDDFEPIAEKIIHIIKAKPILANKLLHELPTWRAFALAERRLLQ